MGGSIDETSTRAPRPLGERSQVEEVLRYIPIVGLMYVMSLHSCHLVYR